MKKIRLKNGITIVLENRKTDSVAIQVTVGTGSNDEDDRNRGISHFIEHMLFEGTKNRTTLEIANQIESLGGSLGAYTSTERTCYYAKVLKKHVNIALDVLFDVIMNPLFEQKAIDKERDVILSEIKLKNDEPRFYQWLLFQKSLFRKMPAKHPVIGYRDIIKKIQRQDLVNHFGKNYASSNIIVSAAGSVKDIERNLIAMFGSMPKKEAKKSRITKEKQRKAPKTVKEKRSIEQTYVALGFLAPPRTSKESYVFDVIHAILGRGLSGKMFDELRIKRGFGYDVGAIYEDNKNYGFFAAYATIEKPNMKETKEVILGLINNIDKTSVKEIEEAKKYIEGEFVIHNEDTQNLADTLGFYEHVGGAELFLDYIQNIRKVSLADLKKAKNKYLKNYTMTILEPK